MDSWNKETINSIIHIRYYTTLKERSEWIKTNGKTNSERALKHNKRIRPPEVTAIMNTFLLWFCCGKYGGSAKRLANNEKQKRHPPIDGMTWFRSQYLYLLPRSSRGTILNRIERSGQNSAVPFPSGIIKPYRKYISLPANSNDSPKPYIGQLEEDQTGQHKHVPRRPKERSGLSWNQKIKIPFAACVFGIQPRKEGGIHEANLHNYISLSCHNWNQRRRLPSLIATVSWTRLPMMLGKKTIAENSKRERRSANYLFPSSKFWTHLVNAIPWQSSCSICDSLTIESEHITFHCARNDICYRWAFFFTVIERWRRVLWPQKPFLEGLLYLVPPHNCILSHREIDKEKKNNQYQHYTTTT